MPFVSSIFLSFRLNYYFNWSIPCKRGSVLAVAEELSSWLIDCNPFLKSCLLMPKKFNPILANGLFRILFILPKSIGGKPLLLSFCRACIAWSFVCISVGSINSRAVVNPSVILPFKLCGREFIKFFIFCILMVYLYFLF